MANKKQEFIVWWSYESPDGLEEGYFPIKATSRTKAEEIFLQNNTPHRFEKIDGKPVYNKYGFLVECVYTKDEYDEMIKEYKERNNKETRME